MQKSDSLQKQMWAHTLCVWKCLLGGEGCPSEPGTADGACLPCLPCLGPALPALQPWPLPPPPQPPSQGTCALSRQLRGCTATLCPSGLQMYPKSPSKKQQTKPNKINKQKPTKTTPNNNNNKNLTKQPKNKNKKPHPNTPNENQTSRQTQKKSCSPNRADGHFGN